MKKIKTILATIFSLTVFFSGAGLFIYQKSLSTLSHAETSDAVTITDDNIKAATKPIAVLLAGVDADDTRGIDWGNGNSDTLILAILNPVTEKTTLISLERDLLVNIYQNGKVIREDKLNSTYQTGGIKSTTETIENLFDITIPYTAQINMDGLKNLVDAVGGITVNNTLGFPISIANQEPQYTATIPEGKQTINGEQALVYSRMRYDDPEGDYGRQKRQQEVIKQVTKQLLSLNSITNYQSILEVISSNLKTNIKMNTQNLMTLLSYKKALNTIESEQVLGSDYNDNGISYQIMSNQEQERINTIIENALAY